MDEIDSIGSTRIESGRKVEVIVEVMVKVKVVVEAKVMFMIKTKSREINFFYLITLLIFFLFDLIYFTLLNLTRPC